MIKNYENPIEFDISKKIEGLHVLYTDLFEISQGGPEVGTLCINGKCISNYFFGGPFLKNGDYLYTPVLIKKFLGTGFKLAEINVITLNVSELGKLKNMIFLEKVIGNEIFFFEDLNKTKSNSYVLSP
jgi:hypothetical protein